MPGKKTNVPMVRIQERAPEEKWMKDAKVAPSAIHQRTGVVDAADLYRQTKAQENAAATETAKRLESGPDVFEGVNAQALERRTAAAAAEASRADKLEAEKKLLEEKVILTDKALSDAQDNVAELRSRVKRLKSEFSNEKTKKQQAQNLLAESTEDRRAEAAEFAEKMGAATQRIQELKAQDGGEKIVEEVEVEVYPNKIIIQDILNVIRKGGALILKTQVKMDDEIIPMTIRSPFKKMKAAIDKADRISDEIEEEEEGEEEEGE